MQHYDSIVKALEAVYPNEQEWHRLEAAKSRPEQKMLEYLEPLFPDLVRSFRHPDLVHFSGIKMELDAWIPSQKLAFEYQGQHHYKSFRDSRNRQDDQKRRDQEKRQACESNGITLVEVPYWWDESVPQLIATIKKYKPDVEFAETAVLPPTHLHADPIPETHPTQTSGTQFMYPTDWKPSVDPTNWWLRDRTSGLRVYWDGSKFSTVMGKILTKVPDYMTASLPPFPLDGELCSDEANFFSTRKTDAVDWKHHVVFCVTDAPEKKKQTFEQRYDFLKTAIKTGPHVKLVEYVRCEGIDDLMCRFVDTIDRGGNGLVIHKGDSYYEAGSRSQNMQLVKPEYLDIGKITAPQTHNSTIRFESLLFGHCAMRGKVPSVQNMDLSEGSVIGVTAETLNSRGRPDYVMFNRHFKSAKMNDVINYFVNVGDPISTLQRSAKCCYCEKIILPTSLRVQVKGISWPFESDRDARFRIVSFCSPSCLPISGEIGLNHFPPFDKRIGISRNLARGDIFQQEQLQKLTDEFKRLGIEVLDQGDKWILNDQLYTFGVEGK